MGGGDHEVGKEKALKGHGRSDLKLALTLLGALALWEALGRGGFYPPHLFPPPSRVFPVLAEMARSGELWGDFKASAFRWGLGFILGTALGLVGGLLSGRVGVLRETASQLLHFMRSTPFIVLIPLVILWFGLGELGKVLLVAWGVFFPVWLNAQSGVEGIEEEYLWAAWSLGIRGWRMYTEVLLPRALPFVLAGMRISISTGTFALAAAEMAGAFEGLAFRVFYAHQMFQTDRMMAGIVIVGCLGFAMDRLFFWGVRAAMPWWEEPDAV